MTKSPLIGLNGTTGKKEFTVKADGEDITRKGGR
jgi:hypothetical protein